MVPKLWLHIIRTIKIKTYGSFTVSAIIHISEIANELHEESPTYSTTNLLSDLGGALGLCLGLSIWTILKAMCKCKMLNRVSVVNIFLGYYMGYKQLLKVFPILSTKSQPFIPKDVPKKGNFIKSHGKH